MDQRVKGTFKAHYTWYSMEMMVSAMEENPDEHHEVWKDYTTEDAIVVTKKKKNKP